MSRNSILMAHLKTRIAKATAKTKDELKFATDSALHQLKKLPEIVASFFHAPLCKYTAA